MIHVRALVLKDLGQLDAQEVLGGSADNRDGDQLFLFTGNIF